MAHVISVLNESQTEQLLQLYHEEWWSSHRDITGVKRMLDNTDVIVALEDEENGDLLAFARILTDFTYRATIFDVIVRKDRRGENLGTCLLDAIVGHEKLRECEGFELYCLEELVPYYERWGFTADLQELRLMIRRPRL